MTTERLPSENFINQLSTWIFIALLAVGTYAYRRIKDVFFTSSLRVGESGILTSKTHGEIAIAVGEKEFERLVEDGLQEDFEAFKASISTGSVFLVPDSTKVLLLESNGQKSKVHFVDGQLNGIAGWVNSNRLARP